MGVKVDTLGTKFDGLGGHLAQASAKEDEHLRHTEGFTSKMGGLFGQLGSTMGNFGLPFGDAVERVGAKMEAAQSKAASFGDKLGSLGKGVAIGGAAGLVAASAEAVHLAANYQQVDAAIAATAGISQEEGKKIGDAFLTTGFQTTFSAQQIAGAYAPVAAQLGTVEGHALSTKEALADMTAATDLAEGSGNSLATATSAEAAVMQAYHLQASQAADATNTLFNASRLTHAPITTVSTAIDRLHARLGVNAPSLQETGALMVSMAEHGQTGARGIMMASSALQSFLKQGAAGQGPAAQKAIDAAAKAADAAAAKMAAAQKKLSDMQAVDASHAQLNAKQELALANARDAVTTATQKYGFASPKMEAAQKKLAALEASAAQQGTTTLSQQIAIGNARDALAAATNNHAAAVANLNNVQAANNTLLGQMGIKAYDANGKFVGLDSVIAQLQPKLKGMTDQQRTLTEQQLFGTNAAGVMNDIIMDGSHKFDMLTKSVGAAGSAHAAAEKQAETLHGQEEKLKSGAEDLGVQFGQMLIPKLLDLEKITASTVGWFEKHKAVAEALGLTIAGVLGVAVATFAYQTAAKFVSSVGDMVKGVGTLKDKITGIGSGDTGLAAEGEGAATALESATTPLENAASALNEAAASLNAAADKLSGAGAEASAELDTAGTTLSGEMDAGAATASAELDAAGVSVATDLEAGAGTAAGELGAGAGVGAGGLAAGGAAEAAGGVGLGEAAAGIAGAPVLPVMAAGAAAYGIGSALSAHDKIDTVIVMGKSGQPVHFDKQGVPLYSDKKPVPIGDLRQKDVAYVMKTYGDPYLAQWFNSDGTLRANNAGVPPVGSPGHPARFALGGIVTGPTLAMLGEGGHPEAVLPLDDPARTAAILHDISPHLPTINATPSASAPSSLPGGGGGTVNHNTFETTLLTVPMTAEEVARELAWSLERV